MSKIERLRNAGLFGSLRLLVFRGTSKFSAMLWTMLNRFKLRCGGAKVHNGLRIAGKLNLHNHGSLTIGKNVRMNSGRFNYVGCGQPMSIWVGEKGRLSIGDGTGISNTVIVCEKQIEIGDEVMIGGGCQIFDTDFHQIVPEARISCDGEIKKALVKIGNRAFVGAACIILKGVSIGEGAVIGAGSIVSRDIPPMEIWAGTPAKKIGIVPSLEDIAK